MDKSTEAIFWLKEFSKSWVYVISDKVVYYEQVSKSDSGGIIDFTRNGGAYIKTYLCHNLWLEILFWIRRKGKLEFYCALIESAEPVNREIFSRARQSSGDRNSGCSWQDNSVLINNINYVEYPERMSSLLPIRSIIRLHRLNVSPNVIMKVFESFDEFSIPLDEEGETGTSVLRDGKRPSDIVESRTQSVSNLTYQQSPSNGVFSFDEVRADDIVAILNVFIDGSSVRLTCDEGFNFSVEDIKVFLRPVDTSEGVSHILHMVSPCE